MGSHCYLDLADLPFVVTLRNSGKVLLDRVFNVFQRFLLGRALRMASRESGTGDSITLI